MKIAYLISAYKDPEHLHRLIKALSFNVETNVMFFIHVDAKVNIKPFIECSKEVNVEFVENRFWVQWGGVFTGTLSERTITSSFC